MSRLFLIIDGYNLMHAAGLGRGSYGPGELERRRRRLVQQLASRLDGTAAADAIVIFDAVQSLHTEPSTEEVSAPVKVRFSRPGHDADSEIELLLDSHSSPRQVLVISSDHRLHKAARRRGAKCIDSEDFWDLLETGASVQNLQKKGPGRQKKPGTSKPPDDVSGKKVSKSRPAETDYAEDFLKIDISEIKRAMRREEG